MNIHPDGIIYIAMVASSILGFALGRFERKDSYSRMYRHGFNIGKQVGKSGR